VKFRLATIFVALLVLASTTWAADSNSTEENNTILKLVLKHSFDDGGYTVVSPDTGFHGGEDSAKEIKERKQYILDNLQTNGVSLGKLVDRLFEQNKKSVRLTIESSLKDGYLIDSGRKFDKYFEKGGGGWDKWYKENPKAHGSTTVSLPVYDKAAGLVLVYTGTQSHWLAGSGYVILYQYKNGELTEINRVMMWIS
jgi:hypothetical protein